jgi:thioredoxin-like negative regulator of GroEL
MSCHNFRFQKASGTVKVGAVDGDSDPILVKRLRVQAYPTVLLFRDGKVFEYKGRRSVPELQHFFASGYRWCSPTFSNQRDM